MITPLNEAIVTLHKNESLTHVLANQHGVVMLCGRSGLVGLVSYVKYKNYIPGWCIADKVVGKAAALMIKKLKITSVYAITISTPAKEYLMKSNIDVIYEEEVPHILNKNRDGLCPMELAVENIDDENEAYKKLKEHPLIKNTLKLLFKD